MKKIIFLAAIMILFLPMVYGEQTVKTIIIPLEYQATLGASVNYLKNVSIDIPDGISKILSFEIFLNGDIAAGTNVYGLFGGNGIYVSCNPESWPIYIDSTSYKISFDCTDLVKQADWKGSEKIEVGFYVDNLAVNIKPEIRMTYVNKPRMEFKVYGTEYIPGEIAKPFLQFLDEDKQPINDSSCFLDIYYPNSTKWHDDLLMSYGDDGLYYRNVQLPDETLGIYMISAKCYQPLIFDYTEASRGYDGFESGDFVGGEDWSQIDWDFDVETIEISISEVYEGNYSALITGAYGYLDRGFTIDLNAAEVFIEFWYYINGWQTTEQLDFWLYDGDWTILRSFTKDDVVQDQWNYINFTISSDDYNFGNMLISFDGLYLPSAGDQFYVDEIQISQLIPNITIGNETGYEILRGAGEIHIGEIFGAINNSIGNVAEDSAEKVWTHTERNLTNATEIAGDIWSYESDGLNVFEQIALAVWEYVARYVHGEII